MMAGQVLAEAGLGDIAMRKCFIRLSENRLRTLPNDHAIRVSLDWYSTPSPCLKSGTTFLALEGRYILEPVVPCCEGTVPKSLELLQAKRLEDCRVPCCEGTEDHV